jgi:hypothetical protein
MKALGIASPVLASQLDYGYTHLTEQLPEIRMNAVDELGPEFDGHCRTRIVDGQKAAARTISRLENDSRHTPPGQLCGGGEARYARSDYDDFYVGRIFHRPGF